MSVKDKGKASGRGGEAAGGHGIGKERPKPLEERKPKPRGREAIRKARRPGQGLGIHQPTLHRVWRAAGEYHGGRKEVSPIAPARYAEGDRCSAGQPGLLVIHFLTWVSQKWYRVWGGHVSHHKFCPLHALTLPLSSPPIHLGCHSSMAQRADLLEFDCQLTRDGVVVVSHDKNLSRQSGLNKDINTLDFKVSCAAPHAESRHSRSYTCMLTTVVCCPQELPLYKKELEIYFSPGRTCGASLLLPSHPLTDSP